MTPEQVKLVQQTFGQVAPIADKAAWTETYMTLASVMQKAAATMAPSAAPAVATG
jgi:hypothetical protein